MRDIERQLARPSLSCNVRLAAEAELLLHARQKNFTLTADSLQEWVGNCWFGATKFFLRQYNIEPYCQWELPQIRRVVLEYMIRNKPAFIDSYYTDEPIDDDVERHKRYEQDCLYLRDSSNYETKSSLCDLIPSGIAMMFSMSISILNYRTGDTTNVGHEDNKYKMFVGRITLPDVEHVHALVIQN